LQYQGLLYRKKPLISEAEAHADAEQKDDHHGEHHHHQQQQQSYRELSDDNPIENDVEHTTDDATPAGEKSASADSGAEEVGSPEQQIAHATGTYHYYTLQVHIIPLSVTFVHITFSSTRWLSPSFVRNVLKDETINSVFRYSVMGTKGSGRWSSVALGAELR